MLAWTATNIFSSWIDWKELIKYKGFQIAPAELEGILCTHPQITDAVVISIPDEIAGEVPKGYVVLREGEECGTNEIEEWVSKRVAPHKKLRGGIEIIQAIPKTASGKILRRVVRELDS